MLRLGISFSIRILISSAEMVKLILMIEPIVQPIFAYSSGRTRSLATLAGIAQRKRDHASKK